MPNWCEGNIRLRGTKQAIRSFLENEIEFIVTDGALTTKTHPVVVTDSYGDLNVSRGECKKKYWCDCFYIKGTRRNFIDGESFEVCTCVVDEPDEVNTVCIDKFKAAWGIDPDPYIEKSKRHGVDIRIFGIDQGMQFMQNVEIVGGVLLKNEEISFDDWEWECPFPNMGG